MIPVLIDAMIAAGLVAAGLAGPASAVTSPAARAWMSGLAGPSTSVSGEYEACRALVTMGRFADAEAVAKVILANDRGHPGAWHVLGTCRWMAGDRPGAMSSWKMSLELRDNPDLRDFLAGLGDARRSPPAPQPYVSAELEFRAALALFAGGQREESLARAVAAAKTRPDRWAAWVLVGDIRASVLDRDGAEEAWHKALSLRPADKALADAVGVRMANASWCRSCPRADVLENELIGAKAAAVPAAAPVLPQAQGRTEPAVSARRSEPAVATAPAAAAVPAAVPVPPVKPAATAETAARPAVAVKPTVAPPPPPAPKTAWTFPSSSTSATKTGQPNPAAAAPRPSPAPDEAPIPGEEPAPAVKPQPAPVPAAPSKPAAKPQPAPPPPPAPAKPAEEPPPPEF
ncbi:MAG: hypothetical protein AAB152_13285 [Candidatus Coatesbacteria bacterium]